MEQPTDSQKSLEEIETKMRDKTHGVEIKDRSYLLTSYPSCFIGREAVDWLIKSRYAKDRPEALEVGNRMLKEHIFHHVTKDHIFKDEKLFYRFLQDETVGGSSNESWAELLPRVPGDTELSLSATVLPTFKRTDTTGAGAVSMVYEVSPLDEHNVRLLNNVHPKGWIAPEPASMYNVVVIGAGAGGLVTAAGSAGLGAKVALIEKHLMGGDCLNVGCVPSKALIAAANAVWAAKNGGEFGITTTNVQVDFGKVMARVRKIRADISPNDSADRFAKLLGVDVHLGGASFVSKDTVEVNGKKLKFSKCVIATGARAALPAVPGLQEAGYLTNATVFNLTALPARLAVIGAGPVGCELAQACTKHQDRKVTIFQRGTQLLPREDRDAALIVKDSLVQDGVNMIGIGSQLVMVAKNERGEKVITFEKEKHRHTLVCDEILVAAGRKPNVEGLNLDVAGVKYDAQRGVTVNAKLQTSNAHVFAVGDICSEYKFTHMADAMARIVIRNALFMGNAKISSLVIPWCTFTSPEVAHVGAYETDLQEAGVKYAVYTKHLKDNDRSICEGDTSGFVRVLTKEGTDKILGATIVAQHAGDMISEVTTAIVGGVGLGTIATVIHPYPTQSDAFRALGDEFNRTRLTPTVKILFRKLMAFNR